MTTWCVWLQRTAAMSPRHSTLWEPGCSRRTPTRAAAYPDEALTYLQDNIDRLLGSHATLMAGEFLRRHVGAGGDLADLARDRCALRDLLALIEGKRRRNSELEWRADRPAPSTGEAAD